MARLWQIAIVSLLAISAVPAHADTILRVDFDEAPGRYLNLPLVVNGTDKAAYAGIFKAHVAGQIVDVMCADYFIDIFIGTNYTFDLWRASDLEAIAYNSQIQRAAYLFATNIKSVYETADYSVKQVLAAAIQLAVWDILHDGANGTNAGILRKQSTTDVRFNQAFAYADQMILASAGHKAYATTTMIHTDGPANAQTLFSATQLVVPEPSTYLGGAVAICLIGEHLRRNRQRRQSHRAPADAEVS